MAAVVVAIAGTIRPAMRFIFNRSLFSMLYKLALRFCIQHKVLNANRPLSEMLTVSIPVQFHTHPTMAVFTNELPVTGFMT